MPRAAVSESRLRHHQRDQRLRWVKRRLVDEGIRRGRELGWHDCYTFTKAMGEQLIDLERGDLSVVLVRPSIIESSLSEPEAGFLDGLKVADPLILHYSKGRLPDFPADPTIVLDIIPVDLVTNAIIAALPKARLNEIQVYHVATGTEKPLKLGEMFDLIHDYFHRHPMQNRLGEAIRVRRWTFPSPERFRRLYPDQVPDPAQHHSLAHAELRRRSPGRRRAASSGCRSWKRPSIGSST